MEQNDLIPALKDFMVKWRERQANPSLCYNKAID